MISKLKILFRICETMLTETFVRFLKEKTKSVSANVINCCRILMENGEFFVQKQNSPFLSYMQSLTGILPARELNELLALWNLYKPLCYSDALLSIYPARVRGLGLFSDPLSKK